MRSYFARSDEDNNSPDFFRLTRAPAIVNTLQRDTLGRLYVRPNIQASGAQNENPLGDAESNNDNNYTRRFLGGMTLRYTPASWLDFEGNFSYDYSANTGEEFQDKGYRTTTSGFTNYIGSVESSENNNQSYNTGLNATARKNWSRDLISRFTARFAYDQQDNDSRQANGNTLNAVGVPTLNNAAGVLTGSQLLAFDGARYVIRRRRELRVQGALRPRRYPALRRQLAVRVRGPLGDLRPRLAGVARGA